jgi:hypothetical protein
MTITLNGTTGITTPSITGDSSGLTGVVPLTVAATAPSTPSAGDQWFDTTSTVISMKVWDGTDWKLMNVPPFNATGGTITTSGAYTIHTFTSSGTFTPNGDGNVDYLVVAGGGGGGGSNTSDSGGGGGAGGFRTATDLAVTAVAYTVTIGAGGAGGASANAASGNGTKGGNSSFGAISSTGGGFGGGVTGAGGAGGSGGGGGSRYIGSPGSGVAAPGAGNQGNYSPVEGYTGTPTGWNYYWVGGAGGGAGAQPTNHVAGAGLSSSYSGSAVTYSSGGNGTGGTAQAANTGNGGHGKPSAAGAAGGSGIVIVRYLT